MDSKCPNCKNVLLEPLKTNPPGALRCPMCEKTFMPMTNPPGFEILSEGIKKVGFDKQEMYEMVVKTKNIEDVIVELKNLAYEKGWAFPIVGGGKGKFSVLFKKKVNPKTKEEIYKLIDEMFSKLAKLKRKGFPESTKDESKMYLDAIQGMFACLKDKEVRDKDQKLWEKYLDIIDPLPTKNPEHIGHGKIGQTDKELEDKYQARKEDAEDHAEDIRSRMVVHKYDEAMELFKHFKGKQSDLIDALQSVGIWDKVHTEMQKRGMGVHSKSYNPPFEICKLCEYRTDDQTQMLRHIEKHWQNGDIQAEQHGDLGNFIDKLHDEFTYSGNPSENPKWAKSDVQSVLFDKARWSVEKAKEWLKNHNFKYGDVDEKPNVLRFRQIEPSEIKKDHYAIIPFGKAKGDHFSIGDVSTGIMATIGDPKNNPYVPDMTKKYNVYYKGKEAQVIATSAYDAQKKGAELFKAKKEWLVSVMLEGSTDFVYNPCAGSPYKCWNGEKKSNVPSSQWIRQDFKYRKVVNIEFEPEITKKAIERAVLEVFGLGVATIAPYADKGIHGLEITVPADILPKDEKEAMVKLNSLEPVIKKHIDELLPKDYVFDP